MYQLIFGADPEAFVRRKDGLFVAPSVWMPESKVVQRLSDDGGVNRDGMAIEFNPDPDPDPSVVSARTRRLVMLTEEILGGYGLALSSKIAINLDKHCDLKNAPDDVFLIGCVPDYSAYTKQVNQMGLEASQSRWRFAGGHIHVQCGISTFDGAVDFVLEIDKAVEGIIEMTQCEDERLRRQHYGNFGAFRYYPEKERIEYRTPSAKWLWEKELNFEFLARLIADAFNELSNPKQKETKQPRVKASDTSRYGGINIGTIDPSPITEQEWMKLGLGQKF